ncbi:Sec-independent protein translocase protein TatB [Comamonas aquatica]|uniref:Sec-independent protein translocase protein TatB n=1 Tax=Comamonas aquatica TaxID=225991 RepID=A0AA42W1S5_9BURK|nr:Sec-independent protein translocase protein TatB [Comamonas aquatica]MDH1427259.1 Sec-independent protein translocase protein TatB [Comamonas aquatica]MDH1605115.1 Sec-independent protein translocase protein TatB [Comamonas aquatica]MDH1617231.1 Sec-independent protein translocase protein TatB [Comamonas aquatica]MDH2004953.1 Sec-independent protein translocase protein TatB [Comamonas aquatica]
MIDIGISKLALIGAVALVVIGPEKLPRVARTVGTLLGKAQRYVSDVKAEVNRSMELDELKKMKESVETAARDVEQTVHTASSDFEKDWREATDFASDYDSGTYSSDSGSYDSRSAVAPVYKNPGKNFRLKRGAVPRWYKARAGVRTHVQSGAARVARFKPKR